MSGGTEMTDLRKAAEMALEAFRLFDKALQDPHSDDGWKCLHISNGAAEALRQALAQPEQELVGWADRFEFDKKGHDFWCNRQKPAKGGIPLYTAPPKREWVGLTDEEIKSERHKLDPTAGWTYDHFARAIETKSKEKNT
jgi:hypothetical protein